MDQAGLADFLRRRREALQPADVGLANGQRRRTAGLRREEVALLASMSTDFYTRLEQQRGSRPSLSTVGALARALRLTEDERDHLFQLAGHAAPPRGSRTGHVSPALMHVLDLVATPAMVVSDLGVALRQNPLAEALLGDQTHHTGLRRSVFYRWFTDPAERALYPEADHELHSRSYTAALRVVHGRRADDHEARALVDAIRAASAEFAALWDEHEVARRTDTRKRILHPSVGLITLDCQVLMADNHTESLVIYTASPGTESAQRLALLSVIGTQSMRADPEQTAAS